MTMNIAVIGESCKDEYIYGTCDRVCPEHFLCGKLLHVEPHKKCSVHYHKLKKETFYVIKGSVS